MVEKVETRTRSVVEVETVDVDELRCTGPCEDFYAEEELREVNVETGTGKIITAPVCVYCCENLWGIDVDRNGGVDVDEIFRTAASGLDELRGALKRFAPAMFGLGLAMFLFGLMLNVVSNAIQTIQETPVETTDPTLITPIVEFLPVFVFFTIFVVIANGVVGR